MTPSNATAVAPCASSTNSNGRQMNAFTVSKNTVFMCAEKAKTDAMDAMEKALKG